MTLDTPTLLIALAAAEFASALILLAFLVSLKKANRATRLAFAIYAPAMFLVACGTVLVAFRSEVSAFWSITFANALVLLGFALRPEAIAVFYGRPATRLDAAGSPQRLDSHLHCSRLSLASFTLRLIFVQSMLLAAAMHTPYGVYSG
jgi:hypothetical protein